MAGISAGMIDPVGPGRFVGRLVAMILLLAHASSPARAGDDPLAVAASLGVAMHAYHAGDYQRTVDDLSAVIEAGSRDPRAYYFRGLAELKLGRTDEAEADFTTGAEREVQARGVWPVSRSLERVQGVDRLALERHRGRARLLALQRDREAEARRYAPAGDAEEVLRRRRPESIPRQEAAPRAAVEELPAGKAAEPAAEAPDTSDPFGDEPAADEGGAGGQDTTAIDRSADEKDQQAEAMAVEAEATADQGDVQAEKLNAEAEDAAAERDEREEMDPDAGEKAAEEVQDGTTSLDLAPGESAGA